MTKEAAGQVMTLVTEIDRLPDLTRPNVERLLGIRLTKSSDVTEVWKGTLPSGPFAEVALQEPSANQKGARYSLSLKVKDGTRLSLDEFPSDLLGPIIDINPRIPPEGTVSRGVIGEGRDRTLEFWASSQTLLQASFHRERQ